jgi:hypothetical protein
MARALTPAARQKVEAVIEAMVLLRKPDRLPVGRRRRAEQGGGWYRGTLSKLWPPLALPTLSVRAAGGTGRRRR